MSAILVLNADGSHTPVEESAAITMLRAGQLNPESFYWREGMPEWRPLRELSAPPPAWNAPAAYKFTRDPGLLTLIVKVMLIVSVCPALALIYTSVLTLLDTLDGDFPSVQSQAHTTLLIARVSMLVYLLTAIPFAMWIHRAVVNCRGFGARLKYSPAMSVGGFFIPFANLVIPCQAMQGIWKASRNPLHWESEPLSALVGFWWGFYLLTGFLGEAMLVLPKTHKGDSVAIITSKIETVYVSMISLEIIKIILCALAFAMIHFIIRRQKELVDAPSSP